MSKPLTISKNEERAKTVRKKKTDPANKSLTSSQKKVRPNAVVEQKTKTRVSKPLSTFEKEMQNKAFKKEFEKEYKEFLLSELIITLMEGDEKSVRKLAKEAGISPRLIQNLRSGEQTDMKLKNFMKVSRACGYHVILEKDGNRVEIT
jgi:hypothetical protein